MWNRRPRTPELTPQTRGSIRSRRVPTARLRIPYLASCPAWTALMHAVHIHRATCPRGRPRRCSGLCVVCPSHSNGPLPFSCLASGNRLIIFSRPPFPAPVSLTPPPPPAVAAGGYHGAGHYRFLPQDICPPSLILAAVILRLLTNRFKPGLSNIPGPTIVAYTRLWKFYDVWKGDAHNTAIRLHRQYGPSVRIGPKHISVGDPKAIPVIYGSKGGFTKVVTCNPCLVSTASGRID